jgi:hypothetical protein
MDMTRTLAAAALLCVATTGMAEHDLSPVGELFQPGGSRWQDIDSGMSAEDYQSSSRQNLRLVRKSAKYFILQTSASAGIPEQGVALTGAALGLVLEGAKFNLNESKTMALELDDVTGEDRAISLRFKLDW